MAVLKKIKSATLIETLVATVLIVIVFIMASLIINNLLLNDFNNNTNDIENRLFELEYDLQNKKIKLPYNEEYNDWKITIEYDRTNIFNKLIELKAEKNDNSKVIIKKRIDE